jgi:enoyl-CoA hydratase
MALWSTKVSDGVVLATYANPPMNYFCAEATRELAKLIESWRDPAIRAVVLCGGTGNGFITHYSVEELLGLAGDPDALRAVGTSLTRNYHAMLGTLRDLPKVVIAAMNGNTMGGGFELSLACDIRVGQQGDYRYGFPEVRLGILPGGGGTQRLSRLIGAGRTIEFVLRSRIVDPRTALSMGLVHELADDAVGRAGQIATEVAALPPLAIGCAKRAIYGGSDTHLATGLEMESSAFFETMLSDDGRLAMKTYTDLPFAQRRDWLERSDEYPRYSGH